MENKEIILIDLPERTSAFIKHGYQVSNYGKLEHILKSLQYRINHDFTIPDFMVINNRNIDSSEFGEFNSTLQNLNLNIPAIILDEEPSENKLKVYRQHGASDYLNDESNDSVLKQLIRVEKIKAESSSILGVSHSLELGKRLLDIASSFLLLAVLSPLFLIVIIAIRLESKGPIFYWQPRVGTGYKVFKFYKFRSMRTDADKMIESMSVNNHYDKKERVSHDLKENATDMLVTDDQLISENSFIQGEENSSEGSFKKFKNDPRITKVGKWIRKTSIDELPQLFNVLIGDMSLVGNRPLPLYEAETLTSDKWAERFMAPAGITGLWQVTERGKKATSADSRKQLDNEYARKHNLWMDLKILFKTPLAAIQQENV